jgi:hypothetical protein
MQWHFMNSMLIFCAPLSITIVTDWINAWLGDGVVNT